MSDPRTTPPDVVEAVKRLAIEDRIPCPVARKLAEDLGVPYRVVGDAADAAGVRIKGCELGCF